MLEIDQACVSLPEARSGRLHTIVNNISLTVGAGEAVGIVGGSGCGKTTLARASLGLVPLTRGVVRVKGIDLHTLGSTALRRYRQHMQMVFQDPGGSLNGRMRVGQLVAEPIMVHGLAKGHAADAMARDLLDECGLPPDAAARWPHEFSGGQKQRICIARALATQPDLLVCDEPTSALDVSVQARILNLLQDLRTERGLAMLFITHDLAVARVVCDRIAVMDQGCIVEEGPADTILEAPSHPATCALVEAAMIT